jgi:transcriptional regulator with XRE-family HTH domain
MGYRPMRAAGRTERLYCTIAAMTVLRKAESDFAECHFLCGNLFVVHCLNGKRGAEGNCMYGRILRQLRQSRGRSQAEVARSVGISPAHLARLESSQRGLYLEDFVRIAETLGEKPGNLLPNDVGAIAHLKPLIDRLASIEPELLPRLAAIINSIVLLTEQVSPARRTRKNTAGKRPSTKRPPAKRKRRP